MGAALGMLFQDINSSHKEGKELLLFHTDLANLPRRILRGVNFSKTVLVGASFRGSDLRDAKLEGAKFYGVDIRDAIMTAKQLELFKAGFEDMIGQVAVR